MTAREQQQIASEYLFRYRTAKAEVKDIEQRIDRVRSEMMGVKGISYEGGDMPKAHNIEHDLSDYIARIDGLLHDWQDAQNRALDVMREVSDTINSISNARFICGDASKAADELKKEGIGKSTRYYRIK